MPPFSPTIQMSVDGLGTYAPAALFQLLHRTDADGNPVPILAGGRFVNRSATKTMAPSSCQQEQGASPATNFFVGAIFTEYCPSKRAESGILSSAEEHTPGALQHYQYAGRCLSESAQTHSRNTTDFAFVSQLTRASRWWHGCSSTLTAHAPTISGTDPTGGKSQTMTPRWASCVPDRYHCVNQHPESTGKCYRGNTCSFLKTSSGF